MMFFYAKAAPLILIVLTAIVAGYKFKNSGYKYKIVAAICFFTALIELTGHVLAAKNSNNIWLYNVSDLIRYVLWLCFFYYSYRNGKIQKMILGLMFSYIIAWLCNLIMLQPINIFQTNSFVYGGVLTLALAILYFVKEYRSDNTDDIFKQPDFWFCSGLIVYHAATQPFFGLYNWLFAHNQGFSKAYFLIAIIGSSLLLSITTIIGFLCLPQTKK